MLVDRHGNWELDKPAVTTVMAEASIPNRRERVPKICASDI